jgi:hypothetical protein
MDGEWHAERGGGRQREHAGSPHFWLLEDKILLGQTKMFVCKGGVLPAQLLQVWNS